MTLRQLLLSGAALVVTGVADHAFAQTTATAAAPAAAAPAAAPSELGEIVVTARRREERLQTVPEAAVAFSQKTLTEKSIVTNYDLARNVPGLVVDAGTANPGIQQFSIRGRGLNFAAAAGSVETYFAEVPLSAPFDMPTLPAQFFDLNSLTVVKGPQGTLFGRSTTGGAVLVVPQAPTDTFGGYVRLQGGAYGDFQAEGAINLPLAGDRAVLRIAGFDWQRDGYMHTIGGANELPGAPLPPENYNSEDVKELRATLLLRPTDSLQNSLIVTYHWDDNIFSGGPGLNLLGLGAPNGMGAFFSPGYGSRTTTYAFDLYHPATKVFAAIDTATYAISPGLTLKNIFGFPDSSGYTNDASTVSAIDLPAAAIDTLTPPRPRRNTQYTDELQLQGHSFADRLTWIVGGLADITREPGALDDLNYGNLTFSFGGPISILEQSNQDSYGLFGSATFKVTSALNLTAGYRHSFDTVSQLTTGVLPGVVLTATPADVQSFSKTEQGDTANVQADYHINSDVMVYGGWRLGYKRGGFNPISLAGHESFSPEKVDDFFVGVKSDFKVADMPVRVNVEGYYDLYQNMQVSYYALSSVAIVAITANIPKTTFRGFEADVSAKPTEWLSLSADYAFLDAFNTSWPDNTLPGATDDLAINPVPYASRNKLSFTPRFHKDLPGNLGEIAFAPTVSYQSKYYTSPTALRLANATSAAIGPFDLISHGAATVDGYTLLDLLAEWNHLLGSRFDAALNVTNLTNRVYYLGNSATLQFGAEANAYAPPRMINFELSTQF